MLTISVVVVLFTLLVLWGGWEFMKALSNFKDDSGQIGEDN